VPIGAGKTIPEVRCQFELTIFDALQMNQKRDALTGKLVKIKGVTTPSSATAQRKLRCWAKLRNDSTPSSGARLTVKFCFIARRHYRG
jgi:hypothetical protein